MKINLANIDNKFDSINQTPTWDSVTHAELKMHKIHVYPAKFPSFLIAKSLQYANRKGVAVNRIGDIFCGCGTTALEAKKNDKTFWGCDINPVATLIAKVKREKYTAWVLTKYYDKIMATYETANPRIPKKILTHERLVYWFKTSQIEDLYRLLHAIKKHVPEGKYYNFFLVAFSNILKKTSRWLTKSIKPTIDPNKSVHNVHKAFREQYKMMFKAVEEVNSKVETRPDATILNMNFLAAEISEPFLDMLITSPPYVTSYEYADLHQLSTLWLGYANDFRELRNGTIGSLHHSTIKQEEIDNLDPIATEIYSGLTKARTKSPRAALKYFIDIKKIVEKSYAIINPGGLAVFVIGNTTHKNVYIDNAKYISKCMLSQGFEEMDVFKRKISSKILTPYRDGAGKFSSDKRRKKIYSYEFVIIAKKPVNE